MYFALFGQLSAIFERVLEIVFWQSGYPVAIAATQLQHVPSQFEWPLAKADLPSPEPALILCAMCSQVFDRPASQQQQPSAAPAAPGSHMCIWAVMNVKVAVRMTLCQLSRMRKGVVHVKAFQSQEICRGSNVSRQGRGSAVYANLCAKWQYNFKDLHIRIDVPFFVLNPNGQTRTYHPNTHTLSRFCSCARLDGKSLPEKPCHRRTCTCLNATSQQIQSAHFSSRLCRFAASAPPHCRSGPPSGEERGLGRGGARRVWRWREHWK